MDLVLIYLMCCVEAEETEAMWKAERREPRGRKNNKMLIKGFHQKHIFLHANQSKNVFLINQNIHKQNHQAYQFQSKIIFNILL